MIVRRLTASLRRVFAFSTNTEPTRNQTVSALKEEEKKYETPIHLRPYDATKYEVLSDKIKLNTGYALMEVEPFPRARIMRISYNIMEKLKEIPPQAIYRRLTEEKFKHIMKLTDEIEDIRELETALATESLELFIFTIGQEFEQIEIVKHMKPWIKTENDQPAFIPPYTEPVKDPRYIRPTREQTTFAQEPQTGK